VRRFLLASLAVLALALAVPQSLSPQSAVASVPRFVAVAASSYYDSGPVWWVAITEDGQWWYRYSSWQWEYRGIIGPGRFVSLDGGAGTSNPEFVAITEGGEWFTGDGSPLQWTSRGLIASGAAIGESPNLAPSTWGEIKARGAGK